MEAFCTEIITEIKAAKSETELIKVIAHSMSVFRKERRSFNESGYLMNMIVTLRTTNPTDLSTGMLDNINLAVAIFTQLQRESRERIF
ncbi:MAG: hypothetical protein C0490_21870 [Marivirga sp.]|nr:hypothetical protein [Marivirga sp.]